MPVNLIAKMLKSMSGIICLGGWISRHLLLRNSDDLRSGKHGSGLSNGLVTPLLVLKSDLMQEAVLLLRGEAEKLMILMILD